MLPLGCQVLGPLEGLARLQPRKGRIALADRLCEDAETVVVLWGGGVEERCHASMGLPEEEGRELLLLAETPLSSSSTCTLSLGRAVDHR